ncbi:hypothetical protein [Limnohabitans sp. Rim8]|uniref:hypothetical protein n=1 Tax=Limnohabitans sp. Rim8 TaxID=1100718 RepID=UPI0025D554E0|nr:hypothetical protein [Limnohabitans sp. Rim8]
MNEVLMSPEASQEYQRAVEEAANAFMKVMSLRGFQVRDYPQNFVAQMAQTTRLAFEPSRQGAHSCADALVCDMLNAVASQNAPAVKVLHKNAAFPSLRRRLA